MKNSLRFLRDNLSLFNLHGEGDDQSGPGTSPSKLLLLAVATTEILTSPVTVLMLLADELVSYKGAEYFQTPP